ncbi:MAG: HD domain-containing protein [Clostridia bacterium]|nr:HD domain-containing protein [Clostridia bacterium]
MNIIEKAIGFAVKAHAGALRKGTNFPYILHPVEAASIAARLTNDVEIVAAAVLHDVVEDTEYTEKDIREQFGDRVAELVMSCTENKRREMPAAETWMIRKKETIEHLKTASREVKIVAFADKLSNLRSVVTDYIAEGEEFWNRFEVREPRKHVWYYNTMRESFEEFGNTLLYKEYLRLYRMLRMLVQEYEDFGRHDANALEVIAAPNNGYWVLRTKKDDEIMLMTNEELEEFIREHGGE